MLPFKLTHVSYLLLIIITSLAGCNNKDDKGAEGAPLFKLLSPAETHVDFSNNLTEGLNTNVLVYEYFYNGGGVAVGDVNNGGYLRAAYPT